MATLYVKNRDVKNRDEINPHETYSDLSKRFLKQYHISVTTRMLQSYYPALWLGERITYPPAATGFVNFNTAAVAELVKVPYIGPATARRIVSHRKKHGPFKTSKHLTAVKGIGEKTHARIKRHVRLSGKTTIK